MYPTGTQVRAARHELELTQTEFGALLYVTERQVRNWEQDATPIPVLAWEKVQMELSERCGV